MSSAPYCWNSGYRGQPGIYACWCLSNPLLICTGVVISCRQMHCTAKHAAMCVSLPAVINHFVAYETEELLVVDPTAIASNYHRQRLALDVISALPFDWLAIGISAGATAVTGDTYMLPGMACLKALHLVGTMHTSEESCLHGPVGGAECVKTVLWLAS
eukprot:GHRR01034953.1.p1 GENE.GHRR01034953.1~~GHRR01034953.1.p1  ORF type:complete len:159 (-),score=27.55 GHRR01034953.1:197-673(-)